MSTDLKRRKIPFSPPDMTEAEAHEVRDAILSGWITTGPRTKKLEKIISEYVHTEKTVCLNSATAAMEMVLHVMGVGPGDEVIMPAYTYTASASVVDHVGATIKMVDIRPAAYAENDGNDHQDFEMDYEKLAAAITERTKVIVPVDLAGICANVEKIFEVVNRLEIKALYRPANDIQAKMGRIVVSNDCAHSFGASRHGKMAGEIADFSSFSFHAVKNKDALAKTKLGAWEYDIIGPWYKCNMTDIMAALGLIQFERYPEMLAKRKKYIERYDEALAPYGIVGLKHYGADWAGSGHLYITRLPGKTREQCNSIIEQMAERGIATNVHYKPLPMMTAYKAKGLDIKDYPNAYKFFENEITLPLNTKMTEEDVEYIIENLLCCLPK